MTRSFRVPVPSLAVGILISVSLVAVAQSPMDQSVQLQIQRQIKSDIRLRDAQLDIEVVAGQATLKGELPSFAERNRVERICRQIEGVSKVVNRITIASVPQGERDLRGAVERRLDSDLTSNSSNVEVDADGTIITLTGTVRSLYDRRRVQWLAEQVRGVSRVRNELTVGPSDGRQPSVPDEQIAARIKELLEKDQRSIAQSLQVSVQGGVVTLEGEVTSAARRRFYRFLVQRLDGVRRVDNQLEVKFEELTAQSNRPSIDDAALDVQMALDAAEATSQKLRAQVADGKIVIAGTVASVSEGQQIVRQASAFSSGYPVINGVSVSTGGRTADQMQSELNHLIQSDVLLADESIEVSVQGQTATLQGRVKRFADRLRAERLATTVAGIGRIENRLEVDWMVTVSDETLQQRVRERLERDRRTVDARHAVSVTVREGRVILSGRVVSEELRRQIGAVAAGTDGIRSVENQIAIE